MKHPLDNFYTPALIALAVCFLAIFGAFLVVFCELDLVILEMMK